MDDHTHVLCPLSGASSNERGLPVAADVAARFDATLELFAAVEDEHEVAAHDSYLDRQATKARLRHPELVVEVSAVVNPHAPEAIAERAVDNTLVVMATSTQPFLHDGYIGSAAEAVVRDSQRPALLVGPKADDEDAVWDPVRVIVAIDGSATAERALPVGEFWARRLGVPLWLISVATDADHTPEEESAAVRACADRVDAQWEVLHHPEANVGLAAAAGTDSLLVMTSHGRSGLRRIALGSVAAATVRDALAPVLVVPGGSAA